MISLPLEIRLKCPHSEANEETTDLICEATGHKCEGVLDICQPEKCYYVNDAVCGYPIDDCENCPNHPGNYDPFWGATIVRFE